MNPDLPHFFYNISGQAHLLKGVFKDLLAKSGKLNCLDDAGYSAPDLKTGLTHGCEMSSTVQYAPPLPNNLVSNSIDHTFGPQLEDAADKEKTRSSTRLFDFRFSEQEVSIA